MSAGDEDLARLALVIERQRRELERSRADADVASVIAMARGALMERFGGTAPAAAAQLADMAAAAGLPLPEMAALDPDALVASLAPTVQRYMTEPIR